MRRKRRPLAPLNLRPCALDDAASLQANCWPEREADWVRFFLSGYLRDITQRERGALIVAAHRGEAIGFGMLTKWPHVSEISDLIVAEAYRSRGVGSAIITRLTDEAMLLGIERLEIGVAQSNPGAKRLYARLGFRQYRALLLDLGQGPEMVDYLVKDLPLMPLRV